MQYHRDKSADSGDQDHACDWYAKIGKVSRGLWRLKKLHFAVLARRRREIYGLSALGTLSFHICFLRRGRFPGLIYRP